MGSRNWGVINLLSGIGDDRGGVKMCLAAWTGMAMEEVRNEEILPTLGRCSSRLRLNLYNNALTLILFAVVAPTYYRDQHLLGKNRRALKFRYLSRSPSRLSRI